MITKKEIIGLTSNESYKFGYNKAVEDVEKMIDEMYNNQELGKSAHYIIKQQLQELKCQVKKQ